MTDELARRRREDAIADLIGAERTLDVEALVAVFPHPRYELIGNGRVYDGVEACTRYLRERHHAFPDYSVEVVALHHAEGATVAEAWVSGTNEGAIEGLGATRRGFRSRIASFYLFEAGRLTCVRHYFDRATVARQLA